MSINSVNLTGRLTRDPDVRYTDGGTSIARFTLAVDRRFKQDGGPTADLGNTFSINLHNSDMRRQTKGSDGCMYILIRKES